MKFRNLLLLLFLSVLLFLISLNTISAQEPDKTLPPEFISKLDPRLVKQLSQDQTAMADIMVIMRDRADLTALKQQTDLLSRRQLLLQTLQTSAAQAQVGVRAVLVDAEARQQATNIRPLWIINAVAAKAAWPTVLALAARDDVALIRLQETISLPPEERNNDLVAPDGGSWGIKRINAAQVWNALKIDGSGVVIANVDTGVDYLHPDLQPRYRGYLGGTLPAVHSGNWYDSTGEDALYPVDLNGHGTHTMGTAVGGNGIGVAPGARWIAVRAFNGAGLAQEVWLHAAFEWLLAPNGDPALAPNIVNNSWSNSASASTIYQEDMERLLDAGIMPVFAAGNLGPQSGSIGSPASLDFILAVGATDIENQVANFSSRGPSPWGRIKPEISGPGQAILSARPGGGYGLLNGTSMATPHVAGTMALILQADPSLTYEEIISILTESAVPLGNTIPNNQTGWGLVDAYAAVQRTLNAGQVSGVVARPGGSAIDQAVISFIKRPSGQPSQTTTDLSGYYLWAGISGSYDITASAFGYDSQTILGLQVITGALISQNFSLNPIPGGSLRGTVTELGSGLPLSATIRIEQTPVSIMTNPANGVYNLSLPPGVYTMTVVAPGHRVVSVPNLTINLSQTTVQDAALAKAPTILLVDSGYWYNNSYISYFQQALDDTNYLYDTFLVKSPTPQQTPSADLLKSYDIVIWSAPYDSPRIAGSANALIEFLTDGGKLLLSGQDIAYWDGGSAGISPYYTNLLKSHFVADDSRSQVITPVAGEIFDGLTLTISGGDGADNQTSPDAIELTDLDAGEIVFDYDNELDAGLRVGSCLPYRAVNLPFGLEGISQRTKRATLMRKTLAWFQTGPVRSGVKATPPIETHVGPAGATVTHTFRIRNLAETGSADTYSITLGSHSWATTLSQSSVSLAPCQTAWVTMTVMVPSGVTWQSQDIVPITISSSQNPATTTTITRTTKAPAPVLLVDDDRWYNFEDKYINALTANGVPFDMWDVLATQAELSPPIETLRLYPMVVWFTAYDWYKPLTTAEEAKLKQYLNGGGRLILTSQEYLYNLPQHAPSEFATDYLGIYTYTEAYSSTMAIGVPGNPVGNQAGPYQLIFPAGYENWTDALTPTISAERATLNQYGLANGVTLSGGENRTWHTAFFGFGLELLADDDLTELLRRSVGWLSWLGTSDVTADVNLAADDEVINYTAVIRNDGLGPMQTAVFSATFPWPLSLVPGSATGGAVESGGDVIWSGPLTRNTSHTITYQARVATGVPYGTLSRQVSWFSYGEHALRFDRVTAVPVNVPAWDTSRLLTTPPQLVKGEIFTYTMYLTNTGVVDAPVVTITTQVSPYILPLEATINQSNQTFGAGQYDGDQITWVTTVPRDQGVWLTYAARLDVTPRGLVVPTEFIADDGFKADYKWRLDVPLKSYPVYLPIAFKQ